MEIRLAAEKDLGGWMVLAREAAADFPGMDMAEHREIVLGFMRRGEAVCAAGDEKIIGGLLFSAESSAICFLAVNPNFRRRHIAEKMLRYALKFMSAEQDISVTTYRDGVAEGAAARAFYKRMGFEEGRLCEEFGCPVQEFILPHCKTGENEVKYSENEFQGTQK